MIGRLRHLNPTLVDAAIAVFLGVLAELELLLLVGDLSARERAADALTLPFLTLPLALRRRAPTVALILILAAERVQELLGGGLRNGGTLPLLAILLAIYSQAAGVGLRRALVGAGLVVAAALTIPPITLGDTIYRLVLTMVPWVLGRVVRDRQERALSIEQRAQGLENEQAVRIAAATVEERARIARELHDIVSHGLGLMVLQAGVAQNLLTRDLERARQALDLVRQTGQESMAEMGRLVSLIRADGAGPDPQPTFADIDRLVGAQRAAGARVDLDTQGCPRRLSPAVELSAYRVVQESLTNAMKHAADSPVRVVLSYQEQALCVEVSNDAGGGQVGVRSQSARAGLVGLRERVDVFGGQLFAGPGAHGGWTVRALFPTQR